MNTRFSFRSAIAALFLASAAVIFGMLPVTDNPAVLKAQASSGTPLYSWGHNDNGELGRPVTAEYPHYEPARVGDRGNWVRSSTALGGSYAINVHGHLYAWGAPRNAPQMAQGGSDTTPITTPTRIGNASNWRMVASGASGVAAINTSGHLYAWGENYLSGVTASTPTRLGSASNWTYVAVGVSTVFAINSSGQLYAAGHNWLGQLGLGDISNRSALTRVGDRTDWVLVSAGNMHTIALNRAGEIYSWGVDEVRGVSDDLGGRLGREFTPFTGVQQVLDFHFDPNPGRVETPTNWRGTDIVVTMYVSAAINGEGEIWTWGRDYLGQLGRWPSAGNPANRPRQVGTADNWTALMGGNSHFLAINESRELWAWGNNAQGQLGTGQLTGPPPLGNVSNTALLGPVKVADVERFSGAARGGGIHSLMLLQIGPVDADELLLTKHLQKPEGTPVPELDFTFRFVRNSFNNNTGASDIARIPNIPDRVIRIDSTSEASTTGVTTTLVDYVDALAGISFDSPGVYSWIVTEVLNSSGTNLPTIGASRVVYSLAQYEMRVYVTQPAAGGDLEIAAMILRRILDDSGTVVPPGPGGDDNKVDDFVFTNQYTRLTSGTNDYPGALTVRKTILGPFADLSAGFTFNVTLTGTTPARPEAPPLTGRVLNAQGVQVGSPITLTVGQPSPNITLSHNYRLVFDELVIGTRFTVTEAANPLHIASVIAITNGNAIPAVTNPNPNMPLTTGPHLVGAARNAANFSNEHQFAPPTGFVAGSAPYALFIGAGLLLTVLALKRRKSIEELPMM